ncbi:hypothetical protein CRUP_030312 [Coryphaenoides rupestris]|nr:hypothetical protein CRUP_030312 [Coryphaenoides rupestris]
MITLLRSAAANSRLASSLGDLYGGELEEPTPAYSPPLPLSSPRSPISPLSPLSPLSPALRSVPRGPRAIPPKDPGQYVGNPGGPTVKAPPGPQVPYTPQAPYGGLKAPYGGLKAPYGGLKGPYSGLKAASGRYLSRSIPPKTAVVRAGGRQEIRCSVAGCADHLPSAVFWGRLADRPMEAEVTANRTHSVATFRSVMPRHDGTLLCKATCGAQSKQRRAVLLVYSFPEAPVVTGHEHMVVDEEVTLTCTARLVCLADGQPPPFITWSFTNPEGELVVVGDQKELVLSDVTAQQGGIYHCLAENPLGDNKKHVRVTIEAPPRNTSILVVPGEEVEERPGVVHFLSVRAVILTNLVTGVERYSSDGLFLLVNVSANDSGLYRVNVTNELGYQTLNFTINVLAVILTNLVTGVERYSSDGLFLLVNVSANDSGLYRVNVTNELGYQTLNFTINVLGRSRAPPTHMVAVFAPVVCVAMAIAVTTTLLVSRRRSLRKGFYQLTKAPPPPPPPLS